MNKAGPLPSAGGYVVPQPQTVLRAPPTPDPGPERFRHCLIRSGWQLIAGHPAGSPALACRSSCACHPCYPGRTEGRFRVPSSSLAFPVCPPGRLLLHLTRLHLSSLALRPAHSPPPSQRIRKLTTPGYTDAASRYYEGVRTPPSAGLQPARQTVVTAYGHSVHIRVEAVPQIPACEAKMNNVSPSLHFYHASASRSKPWK